MNTTLIEEQIKNNMKKAFFDLIDETTNSDEPDIEWLTNLYSELKNRLLSFLKKDGKTYKNLEENFDIVLFKQMIENHIFNQESMIKLVNTTFYWIEKLQAPIRDQETKIAKERIFKSETNKIISTFLKEVHICIDNIDKDIIKYYS